MRIAVFVAVLLTAGIPAAAGAGSSVANTAGGVADAGCGGICRAEAALREAAGTVADAVRCLCRRVEAGDAWSNDWPTVENALDELYRRGREMLESLGPRRSPRWNGIVQPRESGIDRQMAVVPPQPHGTLRIIPPPGTPGGDPHVEPR